MSKRKKSTGQTEIPASISSLYQLIRVLTPAQKRDFKKYTRFWDYAGARKYLALFDMVNEFARKGKDEEALMQQIVQKKDFGKNTALTSRARYLSGKILESVRLKQEVSPRTNRLLNMLQDINFLYYKGLHDECYTLIKEAKKLALDLDKATYLLELSIWERRLYFATRTLKDVGKRIVAIVREEEELLTNIGQLLEYNTLSNNVYLSFKEDSEILEDAKVKIAEILQPEEPEVLNRLPLRAKYWYYNSLYNYYEYLHKQQQTGKKGRDNLANLRLALACLEKIFAMSEQEGKTLAKEEPSLYGAFIDNYVNLCIRLGEFGRVSRFEDKISASKDEVQFYRSVIYYKLLYLLRKNNFTEAEKLIATHNLFKKLPLYENRIEETRLQALRYYAGLIYFILEDFRKASGWYDQILNGPRSKNNPTLLLTSELQNIICLYELGALKKNPTRPLNTLLSKLRRWKGKNEFFHQLLFALRNVFEPKLPVIKSELEEQNTGLRRMMKENMTFNTYFSPIVSWLEAKVNGTKLVDEIRKIQG